MRTAYCLLIVILCLATNVWGQDNSSSSSSSVFSFPQKVFSAIDKKANVLEQKLNSQATKYLNRIEREEKKLFNKLKRKDSVAAQRIFGPAGTKYQQMAENLNDTSYKVDQFKNVYSPYLDSIRTALSFLQKNDLLSASGQMQEKYKESFAEIDGLQRKLNQIETIRKYLIERRHYLQQELEQFGLLKEMRKLKEEVAYYQLQVEEYKNLLNDPGKLEAKLLEVLSKTKLFTDFFNKHSELASLFRLSSDNSSTQDLTGLQARGIVQQDVQQRLGAGPNISQLQQKGLSAQSQLNQLKDKFRLTGNAGSDDIPDFKPRSTRTKTFLKRLEFGANIQSTRSDYFFPTTTDIGLSVGYKLSDKSILGIGTSGKVGWGKDIRHITVTGQGISLRSFLDVMLKRSFYATAGFEYNYQQPFRELQNTYHLDNWSRSSLIGLSKIISLQNKLFKKTKVQLLWDFLSYRQIPRTQPIKFRIGYNF